jgi:hypothetical protein
MRDIYIHIYQLRIRFKEKYLEELHLSDNTPITHQKLFMGESCGITKYHDMIRILGELLEVTVLRNQYNAYEGIAPVGRAMQVFIFNQILHSIIKKINKQTRNAPRHPKSTLHLNEYRANLKAKAIRLYIQMFKELRQFRDKRRGPKEIWFWRQEYEMRKAYIKSSPLRVLKRFRKA